jgi:hypothetical protein
MQRFRVTARRKTGWTGTEEGRAWGSTLDERGNRTERRLARTGGREAGWAWDSTADERRQHEGGGGYSEEDRRPKAVGFSQGTQHNETTQRAVGGGIAPMSRVHDKADERVNGKWVGRSVELVGKRTAAAAAGC